MGQDIYTYYIFGILCEYFIDEDIDFGKDITLNYIY